MFFTGEKNIEMLRPGPERPHTGGLEKSVGEGSRAPSLSLSLPAPFTPPPRPLHMLISCPQRVMCMCSTQGLQATASVRSHLLPSAKWQQGWQHPWHRGIGQVGRGGPPGVRGESFLDASSAPARELPSFRSVFS